MRLVLIAGFLSATIVGVVLHAEVRGEELGSAVDAEKAAKLLEGMQPVMIDITDRAPPSAEEWQARQEEGQRGGMLGSLADFGSKTITFMNTRYLTANPAEATLASFGKMGAGKRYDRFGQIQGVEFSLDQNQWKQKHVLNAAALFKLAGSRFLEFAGVTLEAAVDDKRQIEVTFVGTTVPKDEAVRRLNADPAALEYLEALQLRRADFDKHKKLFGGEAPPAPKIVLANVVMLNGNFSKALDASVDGKLNAKVVGDGIELKATKKDGEEITLLSPVVRCYRTYSVEFKTDAGGLPIHISVPDREGKPHTVGQVFDLTPDL